MGKEAGFDLHNLRNLGLAALVDVIPLYNSLDSVIPDPLTLCPAATGDAFFSRGIRYYRDALLLIRIHTY